MKTYIKFIGLFDKQGRVHGVKLNRGLNLITGRSSTGKSSLIEIFDFCMASSEDTIPHGVIEENAETFFLWINIKGADYLLGRNADGKSCYIVSSPKIDDIKKLTTDVLEDHEYSTDDYKVQVGILFGIDAENTAENEGQFKDKRKEAGRPSIRNMMPFILQHQNLVANKQAMFYRFDQKEKRENTIGQVKVFAGFVDANYYALSVEVSMFEARIERLRKKLAKANEDIDATYDKLLDDIEVYRQITGTDILTDLNPSQFKDAPDYYKDEIEKIGLYDIKIDTRNQPQLKKYRELEKEENLLMAELRDTQVHLEEVVSSIEYIETYKDSLSQIPRLQEITVNYSVCPFCHQHTSQTIIEANKLRKALTNLNEELKGIPSIVRPLHEERLRLKQQIEELMGRLHQIDASKAELDEIVEALRKNYSLNKQAYKAIYRISSRIELASNEGLKELQDKIDAQAEYLFKKQQLLKAYNVESKMYLAQRTIQQSMAKYRKDIHFEPSLDEYNLVFDLNKFELYFSKLEKGKETRKYLRAVGSGANWLNAHLCLFLALADFFYSEKKSTVPSLLFLDQPSQVYFPAQKDKEETFDAKRESVGVPDDDLKAVNDVFSLLYKFCIDHQNGIQVIVTDHADNLTIEGLDDFETIIAARWRKANEGLIDIEKVGNAENDLKK